MVAGLEPSPDQVTPVSEAKTSNSLNPLHLPLTSRPKSPFFYCAKYRRPLDWVSRQAAHTEISLFYLFFIATRRQRGRPKAGKPTFTQNKSLLRILPLTLATSRSLLAAREPGERLLRPRQRCCEVEGSLGFSGEAGISPGKRQSLPVSCIFGTWMRCCHAPRGPAAFHLAPSVLPSCSLIRSCGQELEDESCYEPTPSITRPRGAPGSCPIPP